jgi:hypothetical protein
MAFFAICDVAAPAAKFYSHNFNTHPKQFLSAFDIILSPVRSSISFAFGIATKLLFIMGLSSLIPFLAYNAPGSRLTLTFSGRLSTSFF